MRPGNQAREREKRQRHHSPKTQSNLSIDCLHRLRDSPCCLRSICIDAKRVHALIRDSNTQTTTTQQNSFTTEKPSPTL